MNLIKTRKDAVMYMMASIWLLANILSVVIMGDCLISNLFFLILFGIIVFIKVRNPKFEKWLKNDLR